MAWRDDNWNPMSDTVPKEHSSRHLVLFSQRQISHCNSLFLQHRMADGRQRRPKSSTAAAIIVSESCGLSVSEQYWMTDDSAAMMASQVNPDDIQWTRLDLDELSEVYWTVIAPAFAADGHDPETDRPTYEWLFTNGYRGLIYALREYHDRTFSEFWRDDFACESDDSYDWNIEDTATITAFEHFLARRQQRCNWSDSTVRTLRTRLAQYARAYATVTGDPALLTTVAPESDASAHEAVDACWATFDYLDEQVSRTTLHRIYLVVSHWYASLASRRRAALNPTIGLADEYRWAETHETETPSTPPTLDGSQVRALVNVAETPTEHLLLVALCAWGLRRSEVAALHHDQLVLDATHPYIRFETRKNGPGTVNIVYGQATVEQRLETLSEQADWNGYLFPSQQSATGHVTGQTIRNWFGELAARTSIPATIGGQPPTPQMARRFWYNAYTATIDAVLAEVDEIAADQVVYSVAPSVGPFLKKETPRYR
jgi:integrase